jgi:hypothetical protein
MSGHNAPSHFHCHDGGDTFEKSDHHDAQYEQECVLFFSRLAHAGRDWTNEAITEEDAQKSSDQRSGHFVADFLGWATQCAHGDDDTEDGGDDSQARK